jgi:hypothetical protein
MSTAWIIGGAFLLSVFILGALMLAGVFDDDRIDL